MKRKIAMWIAFHLPKYIVLWYTYRIAAHATSGEWFNDGVLGVTMMDAISRWGQQSNQSLNLTRTSASVELADECSMYRMEI